MLVWRHQWVTKSVKNSLSFTNLREHFRPLWRHLHTSPTLPRCHENIVRLVVWGCISLARNKILQVSHILVHDNNRIQLICTTWGSTAPLYIQKQMHKFHYFAENRKYTRQQSDVSFFISCWQDKLLCSIAHTFINTCLNPSLHWWSDNIRSQIGDYWYRSLTTCGFSILLFCKVFSSSRSQ